MPASSSSTSTTARKATARTTASRKRTGRRRPPPRWEGLDVSRGLAVVTAAVLATGALLAPDALAPTPWRGLNLIDLVPGLFLVVAGAGAGWRHDSGVTWSTRRRWRRAGVLVAAGLLVVVTRAQAEPARLAADELLRLAAATGLAALAWRLPRWLLAPLTGLLLLAPAALVTGHPVGRGLAGVEPSAGWALEAALGLPTTGVPLVSLPGAVGLVLIGYGFGIWAHRRPPGPATGAALSTVGIWCLLATIVVGQVIAAVPALLDLPVSLAATGIAALVLGAGHLAATWGEVPGLAATGRTALPLVLLGTLAVASIPAGVPFTLPVAAALTAGGAVAAAAIGGARTLDLALARTRWTLRA